MKSRARTAGRKNKTDKDYLGGSERARACMESSSFPGTARRVRWSGVNGLPSVALTTGSHHDIRHHGAAGPASGGARPWAIRHPAAHSEARNSPWRPTALSGLFDRDIRPPDDARHESSSPYSSETEDRGDRRGRSAAAAQVGPSRHAELRCSRNTPGSYQHVNSRCADSGSSGEGSDAGGTHTPITPETRGWVA